MSHPHLLFLDCTRIVAHRWSGRTPTGIDRVCEAYCTHFASRAQAVVQLRGRVRVLTPSQSTMLFAMLEAPRAVFRRRFAGLVARIGTTRAEVQVSGAIYLNVSHTDFDLDRHLQWTRNTAVRPVYLVHDLIPIEHPHFTTPHKARRHAGRVRRALETASGIIANSQTTASALASFAATQGVEPPPVLVAPLGVSRLAAPAQATRHNPAIFVCVSTIERRKNHLLLLKVWQQLIARHGDAAPRLVLIGRWGVGSREVQRHFLADAQLRRFVTIKEDCDDAEVGRHLRSATALLAPSLAEGFGLPVAEALALGVPVIASDIPAFREVGWGIPTFLDPDTPVAWLEQVEGFTADDNPERQRQLAALEFYHAPHWRDHFRLVEDWLADLSAARSGRKMSTQARPVQPAGTMQ